MNLIVLFVGKTPFLLDNVQRDKGGRIERATVINGRWGYLREGDTVFALGVSGNKAHNWVQTKDDEREVEIPLNIDGDYERIINWAKQK